LQNYVGSEAINSVSTLFGWYRKNYFLSSASLQTSRPFRWVCEEVKRKLAR
jgi:hypothetical protein